MKPHTPWLAGTSVLPVLFSFGVSFANPACPANTVSCYGSHSTSTTSADSASACGDSYVHSRYDLIHGTFHVDSRATCGGDCSSGSSVDAEDQYHVEGLPPGTPLTFTAEMTVSLQVGYTCANRSPYGSASATLREGAANQSSASISTPSYYCPPGYSCCSPVASSNQVLRVTIVRSVGEVFPIHFNLTSSGSTPNTGDGQLGFAGLPSGASVVSCQGFRQDFVTPSRPTSWGYLKLLYR